MVEIEAEDAADVPDLVRADERTNPNMQQGNLAAKARYRDYERQPRLVLVSEPNTPQLSPPVLSFCCRAARLLLVQTAISLALTPLDQASAPPALQ